MIETDEMMKYIKNHNIYMSPDAAYESNQIYYNGETSELFYLLFVDNGVNEVTKENDMRIMLYTSIDMIILTTTDNTLAKKLIKLDRFQTIDIETPEPNIYPSIHQNIQSNVKKIFYQNLLMFLLLKIPDTKSIIYLEKQQNIKDIIPIIRNHYVNTFGYNIESISQRFAKFINQ